MPQVHSTQEQVASALGGLLQPLTTRLASGEFRLLLEELGLGFPPSVDSDPGVVDSALAIRQLLTDLPGLTAELESAVDGGQAELVAAKAIELGALVRSTMGRLVDLGAALRAAAAGSGIPSAELDQFTDELPARLLDYLAVRTLEPHAGLNDALELVGVVEVADVPAVDPQHPAFIARRLDLPRLIRLITDPAGELETLYQWGSPGFDGEVLLATADRLFTRMGLPVISDDTGPVPVLDLMALEVSPITTVDPPGLSLAFVTLVEAEGLGPFERGDWTVEFGASASLQSGDLLIIQPGDAVTLLPEQGEVRGESFVALTGERPDGERYLILGQAGGSRIDAQKLVVRAGVGLGWNAVDGRAEGQLEAKGAIQNGAIVLDVSNADSFVATVLSGSRLESEFGAGLGYSTTDGLFLEGSATLDVRIPLHADLGPVHVDALTVTLGVTGSDFVAGFGVDFTANLGPITVTVQELGFRADVSLPADRQGSAGPVDIDLRFKTPEGVGLALNAGPVKGGGFLSFDRDREEYAGALELVVSDWITLKAVGLVTTRLPDGSKGFSLLIVITVEFGSGIQLGLGFTLLGVGGILGLNRTARIEQLTEGVRTGAVESVMFPKNVIANAPRIISDLRRYFPPQQDVFLVGPIAKIGWGTPRLVSAQVGVVLEFPSVDITILGVIKVTLPDEHADVLRLQVNFIGRIEPSNKLLWFYAELFDSRILSTTIEGGFGLLVNWGDNANFVVTAGGFHPQYNPPPLPFPEPPRLAIPILNESHARIRVEGYFAVTSNSVQFGARAELYFGLSEFRIEGHLSFDVLFQFDPFFFSFSLSVSLSVKVFGVGLFSVGFKGHLEGPTPWFIKGKGKISLLFFKISVPFSHRWGGSKDTKLSPIAVRPLLEKEFAALTNWQAEVPSTSQLLVSLRQLGETVEDQLVLHPVGRLRVSQRRVPLGYTIDRVGNQRPSDFNRFEIKASLGGGGGALADSQVREQFAIGQYADLSASEKTSVPGFQPMQGGIAFGVPGEQVATSRAVRRVIRYETTIIDTNFRRQPRSFFGWFVTGYAVLNEFLFGHFLKGTSTAQSPLSKQSKDRLQPFADVIEVRPHLYSVVSTADNRPATPGATSFSSQAEAEQFLAGHVASSGGAGPELHVVPNTEVNATP